MSKAKRARISYNNVEELEEKMDPIPTPPPIFDFHRHPPNNTLLDMPNEIKQMIYSYLPQKDALSHRLVCKDAKEGIDSLYHFTMKYDDQKRLKLLRKIQTCRIKEIDIINFRKPPPPPSEPAFKYPKFIKTLHISLNRHLSPRNFNYIMMQCSSYLSSVDFKISEDLSDKYTTCLPLQYNFHNLKSLKISTKKVKSLNGRGRNLVKNFVSSVLNNCQTSACRLTTIDIKLGFDTIHDLVSNKTSVAICSLIFKNSSTLRNLRVHLKHSEGRRENQPLYADVKLEQYGSALWNKLDTLKKVDFDIVGCERNHLSQLCKILLHKQRNLEVLSFTGCSRVNRNFFGIRDVILKNSSTLKSISLGLYNEATTCLDFSIFKDCENLETFKLIKTTTCPRCLLFTFNEITNFNMLPNCNSIEHLEVSRFVINPVQMENFLASKDLSSLKVLVLNQCKIFGEDCSFLEKILNLPNIIKIRLHGINISIDMRLKHFRKIAENVGISFRKTNVKQSRVYYHILWERKTISHPWVEAIV